MSSKHPEPRQARPEPSEVPREIRPRYRSLASPSPPPGRESGAHGDGDGAERSGERVLSAPAGVNVATGTSGSASFTIGTSITLSVTNGPGAAAVKANVQ